MSKPGKATLQTVADELGVSRTTVSNAFNRPDQLSGELRDRILAAAAHVGYQGPDPAARMLRRGRTGALGVVLKESLAYAFRDPYSIGFLGALAADAEQVGQSVLLIPSPPGDDVTDGVRNAAVDAFCVYSLPDDHPVVTAVLARDLPAVFVDGPQVPGHAFVGIDDRAATRAVADHVIGLGHRRIAVLTFRLRDDGHHGRIERSRLDGAEYRITEARLRGVLDACDAAGVDPTLVEVTHDHEDGRWAGLELLRPPDPPTAIVCASDMLALGVLRAAAELDVAVPDQLSVTGFDDVAEASDGGLTTLRQRPADKGRAAGELLRSATTRQWLLPHELIVRATTAPPPG